jgi:signal transduction histidine kinase
MRRFAVPLRVRLTLVFGIGMALVLLALGSFVYLRVREDLIAGVDLGLRSRGQILESAVTPPQQEDVVQSEGSLIDSDEAIAQVLAADGSIVDASSAVLDRPLLTPEEIGALSAPSFSTRSVFELDDPVRILAVPIGSGGLRQVAIVGSTLGDTNDAMADLLGVMVIAGPFALLATVGAGWLLAGAALRPVERMRSQAAAITASDATRRLEVPRTGDGLARLGTTLNSMLDRLQEALERERRFVDDASHELRTPLSAVLAEIDITLARDRSNDELRASLRSARKDVVHLQRLAEDLLVLARSRDGQLPVRRAPVSLSSLIASSVRAVSSNANASNVAIEKEVTDTEVDVDRDRVEQALRNLLDNAIRHTPAGGKVRVVAYRSNGRATFAVSDSGKGFSPDVLPRAFVPFSRGIAESGDGQGTGLGLAIVKAVAEAHDGTAVAENLDVGARVTMEVDA